MNFHRLGLEQSLCAPVGLAGFEMVGAFTFICIVSLLLSPLNTNLRMAATKIAAR